MKYYFIFCLYLIFILPLSAQERKERPQFKLGGALRFNYNFSDWNSGHRDRGGDLGYDVFMLRPTASYKGFLLDVDCRFYSTAFGGFMLKYGWIGYRFSEKNHLEIGLTKVPFGLNPEVVTTFSSKSPIMSVSKTMPIWGLNSFIPTNIGNMP